jgi:hypothetical protein
LVFLVYFSQFWYVVPRKIWQSWFTYEIWNNFESLAMKQFRCVFGPFDISKAMWCNLCPFGIFCGHLVYIFPFWYVLPRNI